jgi:hypothetical protein
MGSVYQEAAGGADLPMGDDGKMIDLSTKFDMPDCYARNESSGYPMTNLFIGDTRLGCKSDADEQLIIHISFQEFVKVRKDLMDHKIPFITSHNIVFSER